ncbi:MAG: 4-hydroxybenzoyl-CoA reductase subunit alpha [Acidobacteria bacterium]|nr:4-hydroxybenzoyl-CoA reductase subunit alpha [Acidobacteriota bacterium]
MSDYTVIGKRTAMVDGPGKVTGLGKYTDDLVLPGMLVGKILRSPHPHARILRIETEQARAVPGVKAVLTGQDVSTQYGILPVGRDETVLAVGRVRYVGEGVAAVAATSEKAAFEALQRIQVYYEPLPAFFDARASMQSQDLLIQEDCPRNVKKEYHHHFGNVDEGFARAHVIRQEHFYCAQVTHAAMEPHSTLAKFEDGRLTVWSSTQTPHYLHRTLSSVLKLPMSQIRVIKPLVGGAFGGKDEPLPPEIIAAGLALHAGQPVKITCSREEVFYLHRGRPATHIDMKIGVTQDGKITAVEQTAIQDGGAFCSYGVVTILYSGALLAALYDIENIKYDVYRVLTNKPPSGAMRGHGTVNTRYAFETVLEMLAEEIGMDPAEMRLRNTLRPNTRTVNDLRVTSYGFPECIRKVVEASGWKGKWGKLPRGRGIGIGASHYVSGAGNSIIRADLPHSTVILKVDMDGGVTIFSGTSEIGQGSDTMLVQIVAETLGLPIEKIRIVSADSDLTPVDLGSYSSRVTFMAGNAALRAAQEVKAQLLKAAANELKAQPDQLELKDEAIFVKDDPSRNISYQGAVPLALALSGGTLIGKGSYAPPPEARGGKFKGAGVGPSPAYSYSAQVAEVSVDMETGQVKVEDIWVAHDCGRALNPLTVEGQIEGSVSMGLGQVLQEETLLKNGLVMNPGLLEYKTPGSLDSPRIHSFIVESVDPEGPFGAKECGEGSLGAVIPAVTNAIHDATGAWIRELPVTPEKILKALAEKEGRRWPR